ncbi:MAG: LapA family protein [Candidatus Tenebribacter mawsonii]|nr:LapA family protein [Candidatus Tenebribacter mawsonii]
MKIKTMIVLFILLIFIIILFQNLEKVSIHLLFWEFEMVPLFILFPITLLLGIAIGFLLSTTRKKKKSIKDDGEGE